MNPLVKAAWVAALRSGEYQQGRGFLRNRNDQYCCLGVLCDLHARLFDGRWEFNLHWSYSSRRGVLPPLVQKWAGLEDSKVYFSDLKSSLATMNDSGLKFTYIADLIEERL